MKTLEVHKKRLELEIAQAKERIDVLKKLPCPDLKALNELNDEVERNSQLVSMINAHIGCSGQPMWRQR